MLVAMSVNGQWVQRYNSTGNYSDYVSDMAVDGQGNVYITGYSNGDFVTIKYNTSGTLRWINTYDGPLHQSDQTFSIALDKQLNIYVLGSSKNLYGKLVYATIKYSNNGEQLWVREYINSDSSFAYPEALSVDSSGNVYVTGYCGTPGDFGTVKYNTDGVFQWARFFGGTANVTDIPYSIATDNNGNVFVTGSVRDSGNIYPLTTIKYDSLGNQKWVKRYYFQNNGYRTGIKILVDINGNIFVAGYGKEELNTKYEFILLKYDTSGNEKWVRRYRCLSGSNGNAYLQDMAIDNSNNIYICGINDSNQAGWD
jgi:outer membrane protein assembly factor BamB